MLDPVQLSVPIAKHSDGHTKLIQEGAVDSGVCNEQSHRITDNPILQKIPFIMPTTTDGPGAVRQRHQQMYDIYTITKQAKTLKNPGGFFREFSFIEKRRIA